MRLIGVVDLMAGRAVHARGGVRGHYSPLRAIAGSAIDGDPLALARMYVDHFGLAELYAADLDAILGHQAQDAIVRDLATAAPLWLDAGVSSAEEAHRVLSLGAAHVVCGLETLASFDALAAICAAVGGGRVAFSLDLRNGEPVTPRLVVRSGESGASHLGITGESGAPPLETRGEPAHQLAARAAGAGASAVIVIDLARVGAATGLDLDLIARVRAAAPGTMLIAGGGVRGPDDLSRLADTGCDAALVASALHDGRLNADHIRTLLAY